MYRIRAGTAAPGVARPVLYGGEKFYQLYRNLAFPAGPAAAGMASAMALLLGVILMAIAAIQLVFMNKED